MLKNNRRLLVVSVITLIGSLGYGIVVPILFAYSSMYGLSYFELGILFSIYSIFELISTPIIGILSDKYGRRPLLILSLVGTTGSFFLMAFAPSAIFIFIARALDGITAGNIPVAQAVISDSTTDNDRAKGFGIIGACYGIGLVAGPAISALTAGISIKIPFIIAGILSFIAVILTVSLLDETNKYIGLVVNKKIFDLRKIINAVFDKVTGITLFISFLWSFAFGVFIYAYQPYSLKVLHLSVTNISLTFVLFGIICIFSQLFVVPLLNKKLGSIKSLGLSLLGLMSSFLILLLGPSIFYLLISIILMALSSTLVQTFTQTLLSKETSSEKQGEIMGILTSYISIGQIIGPLTAGVIAFLGANYSFSICAFLILIGFVFLKYVKPEKTRVS